MKAINKPIIEIVRISCNYPKAVVSFFLILFSILLYQTQHLSFDSSAESFLSKDDPQRLSYIEFENKYGISAYFIILIQDSHLFSPDKLHAIKGLQDQIINEVPYVHDVESIINTRYIESTEDDIVISEFFEVIEAEKLADKKQVATTTPFYLNRIVNDNADTTAILIRLEQYAPAFENNELQRIQIRHVSRTLDTLKQVISSNQKHFSHKILLGGTPVITTEITEATKQDMQVFTVLSLVIVSIVLFWVFRAIQAVVLPMLCLILTVVSVLSMMAIGNYSIQVSGAILPSFLMAVCVADSIHFLKAFFPDFIHTGQREKSIYIATERVGLAMFFTTFTTSVGLLSFSFSNVFPVASFGLFSAIGVWIAFILTITLLPAMLVLSPLRIEKIAFRAENASIARKKLIDAYMNLINRFSSLIILVSAAIFVVCCYFVSQLHFNHNPMNWFPDEHPVKVASTTIEKKLTGTMQVELLVSRSDGAKLSLEDFVSLDGWLASIKNEEFQDIRIYSIVSAIDLVKEANNTLQPEAGYSLPTNQDLLSQIFLLLAFAPNNALSQYLETSQESEMRVTISIPWQDSLVYDRYMDNIRDSFNQAFPDNTLQVVPTGMATIATKAFADMIDSMIISYLYAGFLILFLLMILVKDVLLGGILFLANALPIMIVLSIVKLYGLDLDLFTLMIGSIALGIIVDDTIHVVHTFQVEQGINDDVILALKQVLERTGLAILSTSIVLCMAFLVYCASILSNLVSFGILIALCIALAYLANVVLVPAILIRLYNNKKGNG